MKWKTIYKYQSTLYLLIIGFGIQHYLGNSYLFKLRLYENILNIFFLTSVLTVLCSVILLIIQSVISINRKKVIEREMGYLAANLLLYYLLVITSLYLFGQVR